MENVCVRIVKDAVLPEYGCFLVQKNEGASVKIRPRCIVM